MASIKIKRNILFFPNKEKDNKTGEYKEDAKLRLRVRWGKNKVDFNVGYRIKLTQWSAETQRCKANTTNIKKQSAYLVNESIQLFETVIHDVFKSFEIEGIEPNKNQLRDRFNTMANRNKAMSSQDGLFNHYDTFVSSQSIINGWSKNTIKIFGTIRNHLLSYSDSLSYEDLNEAGLNAYIAHLRDNADLQNSTIIKHFKYIKWFLRWAARQKYNTVTDFENYKPKLKAGDKKIIFLDWEELMRVYNQKFTSYQKHLEEARDVFCFCCFTSLRYSDVSNLKRYHITENAIQIMTIKTSDPLRIELNRYSREIIAKYQDRQIKNDLALPVVSLQKMNEYLKEIGRICKLKEPITITYYKGNQRIDEVYPKHELLTTHAGRRTFICNALMLGISPHVVMKWTGHSDYKAMKPYIDVADSVKAESMKLFDK